MPKIITWLEAHMGTCTFKEATGLVCPGCGIQRSIIALLKGDILECIMLFPALLPVIAMLGTLVDPPATMINASGDTVAAMLVTRLLERKK